MIAVDSGHRDDWSTMRLDGLSPVKSSFDGCPSPADMMRLRTTNKQKKFIHNFFYVLANAMKSILSCTAMLLLLGTARAGECPVGAEVFEAANLSGLTSACVDVNSVAGCDACAYGLSSQLRVLLDYVRVEETTTPEELLGQIEEIQEDCFDLLSPVIIRDVGLFNVATLLNLRRFDTSCSVDPKTYTKTYGSTLEYLESQGVDVANLRV